MEKSNRYVLVYQCGIANVFRVDSWNMADYGRVAERVLQGAYTTCIAFSRGLAEAGALVATAHCDLAGDIAGSHWTEGMGDLWGDSKAEVWQRKDNREHQPI